MIDVARKKFFYFLAYALEKENIGLLTVDIIQPHVHLGDGGIDPACIVFSTSAGYYKKLILPELQRIHPELIHPTRDNKNVPLTDDTWMRVEVRF
jgi:hypothetical protein